MAGRHRSGVPGLLRRRALGNADKFVLPQNSMGIASQLRDAMHFDIAFRCTSPYYPQSNGKIERWHKTLKQTTLRPHCPQTLEQAQQLVQRFVDQYNTERLHSAIGFVTPADMLAGRSQAIWEERDRKFEAAREQRRLLRQQHLQISAVSLIPNPQSCSG